jgi:hypothetical protein
MLSHSHEVDVIVEAEVGVDHDNPERVHWDLFIHHQKGFKDVAQLSYDPLTIKNITATSNLNGTIGKDLYRFGTVHIMVCKCNLIVESCRLQLPFKSTVTFRTGKLETIVIVVIFIQEGLVSSGNPFLNSSRVRRYEKLLLAIAEYIVLLFYPEPLVFIWFYIKKRKT